jgi:anti-anti-sigma regulatory factor
MATIAVFLKIDAERVADCLHEARAKLNSSDNEMILDFASVQRIDPRGLRAMEELAAFANDKAFKIELCGVNVDIYKVLKLAKLAPRFCFLN